MKIYCATILSDRSQGDSLTKVVQHNRLLSYYYLAAQKIRDEDLAEYVKTGITDLAKSKRLKKTKLNIKGGNPNVRFALSQIIKDIVDSIEGTKL